MRLARVHVFIVSRLLVDYRVRRAETDSLKCLFYQMISPRSLALRTQTREVQEAFYMSGAFTSGVLTDSLFPLKGPNAICRSPLPEEEACLAFSPMFSPIAWRQSVPDGASRSTNSARCCLTWPIGRGDVYAARQETRPAELLISPLKTNVS